ncbi:MAG: DNA alkylation repair protein [Candidatus Hodarchaeales archaeon]
MKKIDKIVDSIRKILRESREQDEVKIARFNKIIPGAIDPLVVKTPIITKIANNIWTDMRKSNSDVILLLCDYLWFNTKYYEEYKVIILLLEKFVRKEPDAIFQRIEKYTPKLHTWDLVDQFGMRLCAELVKQDFDNLQHCVPLMKSDNFWIRRISLVSLVRLRREKLTKNQWERIQTILDHHWTDAEYYVNKALSWSLREISKENEMLVFTFLERKITRQEYGKHITIGFLKDCSKHLSQSLQKDLLTIFQKGGPTYYGDSQN